MAAILLAGCSTTDQLGVSAPNVFRTNLSVSDVTYCIAVKTYGTPQENPDGSRHILVKNIYSVPSMQFDIFPEPSGSRVEYRQGKHVLGASVWMPCLGSATRP
jgi:hypothetical protein